MTFRMIAALLMLVALFDRYECQNRLDNPLEDELNAHLVDLIVSKLNKAFTKHISSVKSEIQRLVDGKAATLSAFLENKMNTMEHKILEAVNTSVRSSLQGLHKTDQTYYLRNLAAGKSSSQSSSYAHYRAGSATNGNLDDFTHTSYPNGEVSPWLRVDLGDDYMIHEVEIFNRKDCCGYKLHDFDVKIGRTLHDMALCGHYSGQAGNGERIIIKCGQHPVARHVQIQIVEGRHNVLHVAEVLVWGTNNVEMRRH